jgi:hypothetical protein
MPPLLAARQRPSPQTPSMDGESQLASIADATLGAFQRVFIAHGGRGPGRRHGGERSFQSHEDGPPLGGSTSIWKSSALGHRQHAETCWCQRSPMPPDAARSLRRIIANWATPRCFGCGLFWLRTQHGQGRSGNREGASQRPLMMRRGQCSPAQAAAEEASRATGRSK